MPVGKWMVAKEDDHGLYVEGELTPSLRLAEDVRAAMKHGTIDGLSIGGYVERGDYDETESGRVIPLSNQAARFWFGRIALFAGWFLLGWATVETTRTLGFSLDGRRVIGYDNERGKGDHCHLDGKEHPYKFTTVEQLVEDFIAAVAARREP